VASVEVPELFSEAFLTDPYPTFAWLRREAPVYRSAAFGHYVISRYEDCVEVLAHPEQFAAQPYPGREPADHVRYRNIVGTAFDARFVQGLVPRIQRQIDQLIDGFGDAHQVDLMAALAQPLPTLVLAEILGVPLTELEMFTTWAREYSSALNDGLDVERSEPFKQTMRELIAYLAYLTEHRRKHPGDDLLSRLAAAELDGNTLTAAQILGLCDQLMVAGRDLTTGLIGNCVQALFAFADQLDHLRRDPDLLDAAIDETLRWDSPVLAQPRRTRIETHIGDVRLPSGTDLLVVFAAANRDPRVFPDPDSFDITRPNAGRHLAFGRGIHYCLGAPLACIEARLALRTLFARWPGMRPAPDEPPRRRFANAMLNPRTWQSLPVVFRTEPYTLSMRPGESPGEGADLACAWFPIQRSLMPAWTGWWKRLRHSSAARTMP
jgi:cytochrome P450